MIRTMTAAGLALVFAASSAHADEESGQMLVNVDGDMVEVDAETAAAACGMTAEAIEAHAEADAEIAVCEIDQETAEAHGIEIDEET
jgi:hypothetical protein